MLKMWFLMCICHAVVHLGFVLDVVAAAVELLRPFYVAAAAAALLRPSGCFVLCARFLAVSLVLAASSNVLTVPAAASALLCHLAWLLLPLIMPPLP